MLKGAELFREADRYLQGVLQAMAQSFVYSADVFVGISDGGLGFAIISFKRPTFLASKFTEAQGCTVLAGISSIHQEGHKLRSAVWKTAGHVC